jgi:hypothetical protein
LETAAVRRVAETAIFALGRVETQRQVAIGQVDQHSEVVRLNAFCDRLDRIHTERDLDLKLVQRSVVGTEPETTVLLRDDEHGGLEIPERAPLDASRVLREPAGRVVCPGLDLRREDRDPLLLRPRSAWEGLAFPERSVGKQGFVPIVRGGGLDRPTHELEAIDLVAGRLQGCAIQPNRSRAAVLVGAAV